MATSFTNKSGKRAERRGAKLPAIATDRTSTKKSDKKVAKRSSNSLKKASAPQPQRASSAPASIRTALWLSAAVAATLVLAARSPVRAYPLAPVPRPQASAQASPQPTGNVLPFDSNLTFTIDDSIS